MKVAIYAVNAGGGFGNKRARHVARSMAAGLHRCGVPYVERSQFRGVEADVAVAYGWVHEPIFSAYRAAGAHYLFWDLGYWGRRPKGAPEDGYHRLAVDDWDTAAHMQRKCPWDRFQRLGLTIGDGPREDRDVLVAGMSPKAAMTHGYDYGQWERQACTVLARICPGVPVVTRPKPNKRAIPQVTIEQMLQTARLLVTHHSNAAIDALLLGVPVYAVKGVGRLASSDVLDADAVKHPYELDRLARLRLLADVAYAQWTPTEMCSGEAWQHAFSILRNR
jgi:hypothetical protein